MIGVPGFEVDVLGEEHRQFEEDSFSLFWSVLFADVQNLDLFCRVK
jgi:hypothetical protein